MLQPSDFFTLDEQTEGYFEGYRFVWEALGGLSEWVTRLTSGEQKILGHPMQGAHLSDRPIYIAKSARIEPGAYVLGPAYIGDGAVVRHGAYVRENVILLSGSVLGHASEAKNSLFLPGAHAAHFNYVGDSILGRGCNLGAGTKLSNLTLVSQKDQASGRRPSLVIEVQGEVYDTGLAKLGAILGDGVQTGCNAVLNPGCLVGRNTLIYANVSLRKGYYPPDSLLKLRQDTEQVGRL